MECSTQIVCGKEETDCKVTDYFFDSPTVTDMGLMLCIELKHKTSWPRSSDLIVGVLDISLNELMDKIKSKECKYYSFAIVHWHLIIIYTPLSMHFVPPTQEEI